MKGRAAAKLATDIAMAGALVILMSRGAYADRAHEILGLSCFALFVLHHALNASWYKLAIRSHRFSLFSIVDLLLVIAMLGTAASSVAVSKDLFAFLQTEGGLLARKLHACATAWCFIVASVHMGLHWDIAGFGALRSRVAVSRIRKGAQFLRVLTASLIAAYGGYAFVIHGMTERLAAYYGYSFWSTDLNWLLFFDMSAVMCLFACAPRALLLGILYRWGTAGKA